MSDKIKPHHLQRKAILYVRQSSAHQVIHNRESRSLQYAMRERLSVLGWSKIEIIDDDLGISAAAAETARRQTERGARLRAVFGPERAAKRQEEQAERIAQLRAELAPPP